MIIFVGHSSALRIVALHQEFFARKKRVAPEKENYEDSTCEARALEWTENYFVRHLHKALRSPLDVVVNSGHKRRESTWGTAHVARKLPRAACFYRLCEQLYVATPEYAFLQMARSCTETQLIRLAFELCGNYYSALGAPGFIKTEPLTSADKLDTFLLQCIGLPGVKKARRALTYVMEGSRSPMETTTAMLLGLPRRLGGYGLQMGQLNYICSLSPAVQSIACMQYCIPDLAWPEARFAIEYNGREYHTDRLRDERRRLALTADGWTVQFLSSEQLFDRMQREAIVHMIARVTGKRLRKISPACAQARMKLLSELRPQRGPDGEWLSTSWAVPRALL